MIWKNKYIPFKGFKAMAIWPIIFVRGENVSEKTLNHERIHFRQQIELLWFGFYLLYIIEYIANLTVFFDSKKAYREISFEKEAYNNAGNKDYLSTRKMFGQWRQ